MRRIIFVPFEEPYAKEFMLKSQDWQNNRPNKNYEILVYRKGAWKDDLKDLDQQSEIYIRGHGTPGGSISVTVKVEGPILTKDKKGKMVWEQPAEDSRPDRTIELSVEEACQRLIDTGLPKNFPGAIKFYFCNSGTAPSNEDLLESQKKIANAAKEAEMFEREAKKIGIAFREQKRLEKAWWRDSAQQRRDRISEYERFPTSMAKRGADYFRSKGFVNCTFYGYLGKIASVYSNVLNEDESDVSKQVGFSDGKAHRNVHIDARNKAERDKQEYRRASEGRIRF